MQTWYRTTRHSYVVQPVTVVSELNKKLITSQGAVTRTVSKESFHVRYHRSFAMAKAFLQAELDIAKKRHAQHGRDLDELQAQLDKQTCPL